MYARFTSLALSTALLAAGSVACGDSFSDAAPESPVPEQTGDGGSAGAPSPGTAGSAGAANAGSGGEAAPEAGTEPEAGTATETGPAPDAGTETEAGTEADAAPPQPDAEPEADAGTEPDAAPPQPDSGPSCTSGTADCDGNPSNACETPLGTLEHCGACGHACAPAAHAAAVCNSGACGLVCNAGYGDCDGNPANGCEASLDSTEHCGACGTTCAAAPNATPACSQGACAIACTAGFANCDGATGNGCEIVTLTDVTNCGACGNVCPVLPHTTPVCSAGSCSANCVAGYEDCNAVTSDGCEIAVQQDVNHCGGCGQACGTANAQPSCTAGACALQCNAGFGDCDGTNQNGCEADHGTDPRNCGVCGHDCGAGGCVDGQCTAWVLANEMVTPKRVAVDGTHVYWTTAGTVRRVPKSGGAVETVVAQATSSVGIALDGAHVYWTLYASSGSLLRAPLAGGTTTTLAIEQGSPRSVAVLGNKVFWTIDSGVKSLPLGGGPATSLILGQSGVVELAVDATRAFFVTNPADASAPDKVMSVTHDGATTRTLYSGDGRPVELDLDDDDVFFVLQDGGIAARVKKNGGAVQYLKTGLQAPTALVVDGNSVFVAESGAGRIVQVYVDLTASDVRFTGGSYPAHMAQDSATVYWADPSSKRVYAMKK